jgi:hypothetical protein
LTSTLARSGRKKRFPTKDERQLSFGAFYSTKGRLPIFFDPDTSKIVMDSLKWLNEQGAIELIAVVVTKGLVDNFKEYPHWYCTYAV